MARRYKRLKLEYEMPIHNLNIIDVIKDMSKKNDNRIDILNKIFYYDDTFIVTLPHYKINNIIDIINPIPKYEIKLSKHGEVISNFLSIYDLYNLYKNVKFKKYVKNVPLIGFVNDYVYSVNNFHIDYYDNNQTIVDSFFKKSSIDNNSNKYLIYKYKISNINIDLNTRNIYYYSNECYLSEVDIKKCKNGDDLDFFKRLAFNSNFLIEKFDTNTKGNKIFDCENIMRKGPPYDVRCAYSNKIEDILKSIRIHFIKTELSL